MGHSEDEDAEETAPRRPRHHDHDQSVMKAKRLEAEMKSTEKEERIVKKEVNTEGGEHWEYVSCDDDNIDPDWIQRCKRERVGI